MPITILLALTLITSLTTAADSTVALQDALTAFNQNKMEQTAPLLEAVVAEQPDNTAALVWLAETYRRMGQEEKATRLADRVLELDSCNSFAHLVRAESNRRRFWEPRSEEDPEWIHMKQAVTCDPHDGNAWMGLWNEAVLRNRYDLMDDAIRELKKTGFLSNAALAYGRWMLRTLPPDAILVTNGDMDTYPLLAVQAAEGFRVDVAVAERGLIATKQFQDFLAARYGVPLPSNISQLDSTVTDYREMLELSNEVVEGWLMMNKSGTLTRPVAIAVSVSRNFVSQIEDQLVFAGPFYVRMTDVKEDSLSAGMLEKSINAVVPDDFTGPWVSDADRSPVRRMYTKYLVRNIAESALTLVETLIDDASYERAAEMLNWTETFEKGTELGPDATERIAGLRRKLKQ